MKKPFFVHNAQNITFAFYCTKSTCIIHILWIMWITSCISQKIAVLFSTIVDNFSEKNLRKPLNSCWQLCFCANGRKCAFESPPRRRLTRMHITLRFFMPRSWDQFIVSASARNDGCSGLSAVSGISWAKNVHLEHNAPGRAFSYKDARGGLSRIKMPGAGFLVDTKTARARSPGCLKSLLN